MLRQLRQPVQRALQLSPAVLASWQAAWSGPAAAATCNQSQSSGWASHLPHQMRGFAVSVLLSCWHCWLSALGCCSHVCSGVQAGYGSSDEEVSFVAVAATCC